MDATQALTLFSPFGAVLEGRSWSAESGYRYGFQAQEEDAELWEGAVNYKYRVEDPRLGRFFSVDPLFRQYPFNGVYTFSENIVIWAIELEGLEACFTNNGRQLSNQESKVAFESKGLKHDPSSQEVYLVDYDAAKNEMLRFEKLDISFQEMHYFASKAYGEGHATWQETYAIANCFMNYLKAVNDKYEAKYGLKYTIGDILLDPDYARASKDAAPPINSGAGMIAYGAAINAIMQAKHGNWIDYSNGAIQWEGAELAAKGKDHYKAMYNGMSFRAEDVEAFKAYYKNNPGLLRDWHKSEVSGDIKAGEIKASAGKDNLGKVLLKSNGCIGSSMFFKSNDTDGWDDNVRKPKR
jgi:RHS repeat-associated protein